MSHRQPRWPRIGTVRRQPVAGLLARRALAVVAALPLVGLLIAGAVMSPDVPKWGWVVAVIMAVALVVGATMVGRR